MGKNNMSKLAHAIMVPKGKQHPEAGKESK